MTCVNFKDKNSKTFSDVKVGSLFTFPESSVVLLKTCEITVVDILDKNRNWKSNSVRLGDGWFWMIEEAQPVILVESIDVKI